MSGVISGLLMEKSNVEDLLRNHLIALIQAIKSVVEGVIEIVTLEREHRLKVHGFLLLLELKQKFQNFVQKDSDLEEPLKL